MTGTGGAGSADGSQACELADRRCKPCEGSVPPLTARAGAALGSSSSPADWRLIEDGKAIWREFAFRDFYRTMSFVNALAHIANIEDHHPDLRGRLQLLSRALLDPRHRRA